MSTVSKSAEQAGAQAPAISRRASSSLTLEALISGLQPTLKKRFQ